MKPNRPKQKNDVLGRANGCMNYSECPLCYGCRSYSSASQECLICEQDRKTNICKIDKHQPKPLSMLISKTKITIKGDNK